MAAVQSGARRGLNRWAMPDPVYWVWKKLTSVRVAVVLILLTAFMAFLAVVIPQVPPQFTGSAERIREHVELQRDTWGPLTDPLAEFPWFYDARGGIFNLFNQPYWYALVAVLALAITTCTISRFPPIWRTVRRPPTRVNDAYFARARNRFDFVTPGSAAVVEETFRRKQYRVQREERDGAVYLFADRFQWAQLGTFLMHAGLVAIVLGTLITKVGAEEIQFWLGEGETRPLFETAGDRQQIQVIVDDASADFTTAGRALDFRSAVRVTSGGEEIAAGDVTVNGPLHFNGWRLHQASYYENGAALQVRDTRDGQLLYSETLFLESRLFGPRVTITNAESGAVISEEVVPLAFAVADAPLSRYQLVPLAESVSLALILHSPEDGTDGGADEFHYAVVPVNAADPAAAELTLGDLHIGAPPPVAPRVRLYEPGETTAFADTVVPLAERADLPDARIGAIPLDGERLLTLGYTERGETRRFFYFGEGDATQQGFLAEGQRAAVAGIELEYVREDVDRSQWGRLAAGETQRIGAVDVTYGGAEDVFYTTTDTLPGADGEALVLVERFGQGATASTFEARGGEDVEVQRSVDPYDRDGSRPARLGLGLGGGLPRFDLEPGESITVGDYEYTFMGPREFTGLTVRRDPGQWVFWGSIIAGLVGMLIVFFVPRRRVWAKITPERTYLAGLAGHGVNLRREMARFAWDAGAPGVAPEDAEEAE